MALVFLLYNKNILHDIMSESEREHERKTSDAEGGICFSRAISEGAACAAGGKARKRGLMSE